MRQNWYKGGKMQNYIEERIFDIFKEYLFRDLTQCEEPLSESIFGEKIALLPAEAYFLLAKIEEVFSIKFSNNVVTEKRFNYLGDIVEEICKCLNEK